MKRRDLLSSAVASGAAAALPGVAPAQPAAGGRPQNYTIVVHNAADGNIKTFDPALPHGWTFAIEPRPSKDVIGVWEFGDGHVLEGDRVFKHYAYPGRYTINVTLHHPDGAEVLVKRQVNVAASGKRWAQQHRPVPERSWRVPAGETVVTTETRQREIAVGDELQPDRFVLRFDPGVVASGETLVLRDQQGREASAWCFVERVSYVDGSLASCRIMTWSPAAIRWTVLKKRGARPQQPGGIDLAAEIGRSDFRLELRDIRFALADPKRSIAADSRYRGGQVSLSLRTALRVGKTRVIDEAPGFVVAEIQANFLDSGGQPDPNLHALILLEAYRHPSGDDVQVSIEPAIFNGWVDNGVPADMLVYEPVLLDGSRTVREWSRVLRFTADQVDPTKGRINLKDHRVYHGEVARWVSSNPPGGIVQGRAYPISGMGYYGHYEQSEYFFVRDPAFFSIFKGELKFENRGSGEHRLRTVVLHRPWHAWAAVEQDGRPIWLKGRSTMLPDWHIDERIYKARTGQILPLDFDVDSQDGSAYGHVEYHPQGNRFDRAARDGTGGDAMIGPMSTFAADALRKMTPLNLAAARCAARENYCSEIWLWEHRTRTIPVLNNATYPGAGAPNKMQVHPNMGGYTRPATTSDWGVYGGIDASHMPSSHMWGYALFGSRLDLIATAFQWMRGIIFHPRRVPRQWNAGAIGGSELPIGDRVYHGISTINLTYQPRAAGYLSKALAVCQYFGDQVWEGAYFRSIGNENIDGINALLRTPDLYSPAARRIGVTSIDVIRKGGQVWMMGIISIGNVLLAKHLGRIQSDSEFVDWSIRFHRGIAGDASDGSSMGPTPEGMFLGYMIMHYRQHDRGPDAWPPLGNFAAVDMGGTTDWNDVGMDLGEQWNFLADGETVHRIPTSPRQPLKMAVGDKVWFYRSDIKPDEFPAPPVERMRYYRVRAVDPTGNRLKLETWDTRRPVRWSGPVDGCRAMQQRQLPGRGTNGMLVGSGEYTYQGLSALAAAAVWGHKGAEKSARTVYRLVLASYGGRYLPDDRDRQYQFVPEYA